MSNVFASPHHTCFDKLFFVISIHQTCDKTPFFDLCHRYEKQMRPSLVPRATKGKKTCAISCFNTFDLYETWCILKHCCVRRNWQCKGTSVATSSGAASLTQMAFAWCTACNLAAEAGRGESTSSRVIKKDKLATLNTRRGGIAEKEGKK